MSDKRVVLGIDTSNYTTSVAIVTLDGELVANLKRPLKVAEGERGLRQSDALFAHTANLPDIMREAAVYLENREIVAIGVSRTPRNEVGSYMPCFLAGVASAESISATLGVPLYSFSHQCGHIMAAVYSSGAFDLLSRDFGALHISGGTTELVRVTPTDREFVTKLVGGTADLNAGQVIDRIGVYLGMKFPAGPALEIEALKNDKKFPRKKISSSGMTVNLSGLENMAIRLYEETEDTPLVAAFVFDFIGRSISAMIDAYKAEYGEGKILLAGGVMCNGIIKKMLSSKYDVSFAEPALSADNAVGIAVLAMRAFVSENNCD
ncbi:MAG: peptidase M22 [Clostridia bacterium]|nr:peptidase M22 [Clostridia bacterium]